MEKQTIIVTGGSSGIGFGIAHYFLERGDNVVINSSNEDKLQKAYTKLGARANLAMVPGSVGNRNTGLKLVATAIRKFGSVNVLVNNAGIYETKPFLEVDETYLDRFFDTNLKGVFFTSQAVISQMLQQQTGGVIINIGTPLVSNALGRVNVTAPITSKGAIHALTIQLAAEFGRFNIRTNVVAPGIIRTPLHFSNGKDQTDQSAGISLLNRVGEVDDVAEMVYAVAKSNFINGAIINVDGGFSAGRNL